MLYFKKTRKRGDKSVDTKSKIEERLFHSGIKIPEIRYYQVTDSTNTRAKEYGKIRDTGATSPVVFIADEQTGGRGRLGRSFDSPRGGIYISFLFYPKSSAESATAITAYAAVKLAHVIKRLSGAEPRIKWVNDLYLGGKKLAGILTEGEARSDGSLSYAVCGIGLNLESSALSDELSTIATSVEAETGLSLDPATVATEIIEEFLFGIDDFLSPVYYEEYRRLSLTLGSEVTVMASPPYDGTAVDVLPDYSLLVRAGGDLRRVYTGEVSVKQK